MQLYQKTQQKKKKKKKHTKEKANFFSGYIEVSFSSKKNEEKNIAL